MKLVLACVAFLLISCGSSDRLLVRQFHLRDTKVAEGHEFIRAEMNKRLYGAVTTKEREARLGQFYTVSWNRLSGADPVKILFEYRQQLTGGKVKKLTKIMPASASGKTEIQVTGDSYQKGGRVLSWRITLYDGKQSIAQKQSYLWD